MLSLGMRVLVCVAVLSWPALAQSQLPSPPPEPFDNRSGKNRCHAPGCFVRP
jgi:hypothetical protein